MGVKQGKIEKQARRFLATGEIGTFALRDIVPVCVRLVRMESEKSSAQAIQYAKTFVRRLRYAKPYLRQRAHRALGWAYLVGGQFRNAEKEYIKARTLVERHALDRGRIDRILVDVFMYLGEFKEARRRARMAIATFTRIRNSGELAKARVNYANLLHRQDRHKEARKLYHEAGRYFEKSGDRLIAAICFHNEANTLAQLFRLSEAEGLFKKAEKIFDSFGYDLRANTCRYGLAWLHLLEGKYHLALMELADCERHYRKASQPREIVLCLLDRAEAYLGLNLYTDARRSASEAEKRANKLGIQYEAAKSALYYAKASMAIGRIADAKRALRRAEKGFSTEQNEAFLGTVELALLQLNTNTALRSQRIKDARRRFAGAQLPLWEAICDFQILTECPQDNRVRKRLGKNPAVQAVPHLLARWHTMEGDLKAERGKEKEAHHHWRRACEVLEAVRAALPPVDLRTGFLRNQGDPYCRLIDFELETHPSQAAAWSEKFKTAGLWQMDHVTSTKDPHRVRAEKSLAELAAQVTAFVNRLESAARNRSGIGVQTQEAFGSLQEQVRNNLVALDRRSSACIDTIEDICRAIGAVSMHQPVIQFHAGGPDLVAFIHQQRATRSHIYIDGVKIVRELMARWRFHIERAQYLNYRQLKRVFGDEQDILGQIGEWLISPLELSGKYTRLLILPEGGAANLPWQALIYHNQPLVERYEIVLSPSLRHYRQARRRVSHSSDISVFIGDVSGLTKAGCESDIFSRAGNHRVTLYSPCRRNDWPDNCRAHIWHFSGHARSRSDNPFYSSLEMADGPIFAADFRLKHNIVDLLTLAACRTGYQSMAPGEEAIGLVRSLLEMGARNVLASQWAVADAPTSAWMEEFYKWFLNGESAASSVRNTSMTMREKYRSAYHWAAHSLFGAG